MAKSWRNCLELYVWRVDDGECAIYLWEDVNIRAVCLAPRHGRLGWFLDEAKGPANAAIDPPRLQAIRGAFDRAGVPHWSIIKAIEKIIYLAATRLPHGPRARIQDEELLDVPVVLDDGAA